MSKKKLKAWASRTASIAQLGAGLGAEIVEVVDRMHGSISRMPSPVGKINDENARGISGFVYRCVKGGFEVGHSGLRMLAQELAKHDDDDPRWLQVRAATNGVCGDELLERGNPMAQPMVFVNEKLIPTAANDDEPKTLLLYIHGLCTSDLAWHDGVHDIVTEKLSENLNARVAYLRYNSGRHISENGEELAHLLETYSADDQRIVIIGHSMGGLLARSATHYASKLGLQWPNKFSHLVALGSPHNGAPAERLGNMANTILMTSPYTNPLSRLGNIRSSGIQDLRYSNLLHEDWENIEDPDHKEDLRTHLVPLNASTQYLFVAGTRSETLTNNPLDAKHDLLVTVESAWAMGDRSEFVLDGDNISRVILPATDHLRLMWSCEVYDEIEGWFADLEELTMGSAELN